MQEPGLLTHSAVSLELAQAVAQVCGLGHVLFPVSGLALPERLKSVTEKRMRQAYHAESALQAEAELTELARELGKTHPGAAASLREGMAETLTVLRLGVPPTLARTLQVHEHDRDLPRARQERQAVAGRDHGAGAPLGWPKPASSSAASTGHLHLPKLRAGLDGCFAENVSAACEGGNVRAA